MNHINMTYGGGLDPADIASYSWAMLGWMEGNYEGYDVPQKGTSRSIIVLKSGLKIPCSFTPKTLKKKIEACNGQGVFVPTDARVLALLAPEQVAALGLSESPETLGVHCDESG